MTRYYYTDPIQALWMFQAFKVNLYFQTKDGDVGFNPQEYADNVDSWITGYNGRTKIYVEPESEYIFEPKDMDIGITPRRIGNSFYEYSTVRGFQGWNAINAGKVGDGITILMRDNKNFFNPLIENNEH